ncbi:uncharacterized protein [Diabrotica undecimpunctata]|uniref:uncharacterized protein n=1 Tax=Diabrotica undecimpunctata TaxID=50387 RepID=UPI003B6383E4
MGDYEHGQAYLQKLLEEVGLDSSDIESVACEDEPEEEEQDIEEVTNHDSESEQEISDAHETVAVRQSTRLFYIGKNRTTHWKKHPPKPRTTRTRQDNIIIRLPGPTTSTKNLKDAVLLEFGIIFWMAR